MFKLKQKRIIKIKAMAKRGIVFKVNNRIVEKLSKKPFFFYQDYCLEILYYLFFNHFYEIFIVIQTENAIDMNIF